MVWWHHFFLLTIIFPLSIFLKYPLKYAKHPVHYSNCAKPRHRIATVTSLATLFLSLSLWGGEEHEPEGFTIRVDAFLSGHVPAAIIYLDNKNGHHRHHHQLCQSGESINLRATGTELQVMLWKNAHPRGKVVLFHQLKRVANKRINILGRAHRSRLMFMRRLLVGLVVNRGSPAMVVNMNLCGNLRWKTDPSWG